MTTLVTGASRGIGRELAIAYSRDGQVILSGRSETMLAETATFCRVDPRLVGGPVILAGDLTERPTRDRLCEMARIFQLRTVVLAAGLHDNAQVIELNLTANVLLIYALLEYHSLRQIIHINSTAGKERAAHQEAVYSASKHGMAAFLRALRPELRQMRIRVLDVFLGAVKTDMTRAREDYAKLMSPKEVAEAIYHIADLPLTSCQVEELHLGRFQ